jgi:transcriptional regulator with XRE-family HTH domain
VNKFAEWMKNNDKKQRGVAEKLGISTSTLHDILRKNQMPSLVVAYEVEKYTRGAVTMYDWLDQRNQKNNPVNKTNADKKEKKIKK